METASLIWSDGELVPWDDANVHFLSHVIHYGTGVFEGIRAYDTPEGTAVLRLHDHMLRLEASARAYGIPLRWSVEQWNEACLTLLRETGLESAYIRPQVFYGAGSIGINPANNDVHAMMAAFAWGAYLGDDAATPRFIQTLPRRGYRFLMPTAAPLGRSAAAMTRLIVLPFRVLRPDPAIDFLSFSLPDAIATSLSGIGSLIVRSSTHFIALGLGVIWNSVTEYGMRADRFASVKAKMSRAASSANRRNASVADPLTCAIAQPECFRSIRGE